MDISPRVPPVGSNQRRRVRGRFPERKPLEDGEEERQHRVPHPQSPVDVHPGANRCFLLRELAGSFSDALLSQSLETVPI